DDAPATEVDLLSLDGDVPAGSTSARVRKQSSAAAERHAAAGGVDRHVAAVAGAGRAAIDARVACQADVGGVHADVACVASPVGRDRDLSTRSEADGRRRNRDLAGVAGAGSGTEEPGAPFDGDLA